MVVFQVRLIDHIEVMIFDAFGGGGKGEQVIDGRRHLERTFVTVPHHTFDPFRIDDAGTDDARDLVIQRAHDRAFRARMVIVINAGLGAGLHADSRGQPAFELVIVIRIQQIVFAVILILNNGLYCAQARLEQVLFRGTFGTCPVGIAAPGHIGLCQVGVAVPAFFVD